MSFNSKIRFHLILCEFLWKNKFKILILYSKAGSNFNCWNLIYPELLERKITVVMAQIKLNKKNFHQWLRIWFLKLKLIRIKIKTFKK